MYQSTESAAQRTGESSWSPALQIEEGAPESGAASSLWRRIIAWRPLLIAGWFVKSEGEIEHLHHVLAGDFLRLLVGVSLFQLSTLARQIGEMLLVRGDRGAGVAPAQLRRHRHRFALRVECEDV